MADPNSALHDIHEDDVTTHNLNELSPPPSPTIQKRRRRGSTVVSRVDIGYFDPTGVDELRRTMTRMSAQTVPQATIAPSEKSELTLTFGDGPFDFEGTLRQVVKKCVT
jgi:ATP-binding cassette subfamily G (WHITE) protein 2 (SNQ2)